MLHDLAGTVPSVVVGGAFLWILFAALRREMGGKSAARRRREDRKDRDDRD